MIHQNPTNCVRLEEQLHGLANAAGALFISTFFPVLCYFFERPAVTYIEEEEEA